MPEPAASTTVPGVVTPVPQVIEHVCVSPVPGSVNGAVTRDQVGELEELFGAGLLIETDGRQVVDFEGEAPRPRVPVRVGGRDGDDLVLVRAVRRRVAPGPVPAARGVTVPIDALSVTVSPSGSLNVPFIVATCPSLTVTASVFALTYGRSLPFGVDDVELGDHAEGGVEEDVAVEDPAAEPAAGRDAVHQRAVVEPDPERQRVSARARRCCP